MSLADLTTGGLPVQSIRTCWCIIYMFVCSPTSCLGVANVDIDQNHQLWWSPPGSTINEVSPCQLNWGQREEGNVCINMSASSQRGLCSGLTPGLTVLPDHKATESGDLSKLTDKRCLENSQKWLSFFVLFRFSFLGSAGRWAKQHLDRVRQCTCDFCCQQIHDRQGWTGCKMEMWADAKPRTSSRRDVMSVFK